MTINEEPFAWIPFYKELAEKLLAYRNRQGELIEFLEQLRDEGCKITPLTDKDAEGNTFLLKELDPFTFFGVFNRDITKENRREILRGVKAFFNIQADIPASFEGIPLFNNQKSWLFAYSHRRQPEDIPTLWDIYELALKPNPLEEEYFDDLFERAVAIKGSKFNLTMGLFIVRPEVFISMDRLNRDYLGFKARQLDAKTYRQFYALARSKNMPFYELSEAAFQASCDNTLPKNNTSPINKPSEAVEAPETPDTLESISKATGLPVSTLENWLTQIKRKNQAILQGPPGTGKTFIAKLLGNYLAGTTGEFKQIQFHPSYSYEEFMQGIRPKTEGGQLTFENKDGIFKRFCQQAEDTDAPYVFLIDEINRANLSSVFGELMYLLEYRNDEIQLRSGEYFSIPDNVIILGTMNTADRSIALMDHALRRRFAFIYVAPNADVLAHHLAGSAVNATQLSHVLSEIETAIGDKHYALGHSFFLGQGDNLAPHLPDIWQCEIEPYLEEYFFNQPERVDAFRWLAVKDRLLNTAQVSAPSTEPIGV